MKTYISLLNEDAKYKKIISTAQKNDTLLLLYPCGDDKMSLDMYNIFSSAKCNIEFVMIPAGKEGNIEIAYLIGTLAGKDVEILSDNETLVYLKKKLSGKSIKGSKSVTNSITKSTRSVKSQDSKEIMGQMSLLDVATQDKKTGAKKNNVNKNDVKTNEAKTNELKKIAAKQTKTTTSSDDAEFEEQYNKLTQLLSSAKTSEFDPVRYIASIVSAVKSVNKKEMTFQEAVKVNCSPAASDKIISSFKGKKLNELKDIVSNLHDEI